MQLSIGVMAGSLFFFPHPFIKYFYKVRNWLFLLKYFGGGVNREEGGGETFFF